MNYRVTSKAVEIEAAFDTGEPMANAQVTIYAPDGSTQPWLTGKADSKGHFEFTPPADQVGTWQVKVRQAGHGKILNIPVGAENTADITVSSEPVSPMLRSLLGVVVIGGFVLTAILFSSRKKQ
ncbi:MAG: carboxypeptidase regulatory-like domain-containing protein [Thermosynechococcaceae cyanobacterium]